jgi:hypothetical protein
MKVKLTAGMYILLGTTLALGRAIECAERDEIARTIGIALKVGNERTAADAEKQYGFGLRLAGATRSRHHHTPGAHESRFHRCPKRGCAPPNLCAADVTDAAREPAVIAIVIPNKYVSVLEHPRARTRFRRWSSKRTEPGARIRRSFTRRVAVCSSPLEYKKPSGEVFKSQLADVQISAGCLLVGRFQVRKSPSSTIRVNGRECFSLRSCGLGPIACRPQWRMVPIRNPIPGFRFRRSPPEIRVAGCREIRAATDNSVRCRDSTARRRSNGRRLSWIAYVEQPMAGAQPPAGGRLPTVRT